jgi:hypothetical protein
MIDIPVGDTCTQALLSQNIDPEDTPPEAPSDMYGSRLETTPNCLPLALNIYYRLLALAKNLHYCQPHHMMNV